MARLCYINDCKAGDYELALCCMDCDIFDCSERCRRSMELNTNCMRMKETESDTTTGERTT